MKIRIIALGRAKAGPEKSLVETYRKRLSWPSELIELEAKKGITGAELMAAEADLIEKTLGAKAHRHESEDNAVLLAKTPIVPS